MFFVIVGDRARPQLASSLDSCDRRGGARTPARADVDGRERSRRAQHGRGCHDHGRRHRVLGVAAHHPVGVEPVLAPGGLGPVPRPFNKRVIGIVVGTFSYCLIVLRSVRSSIEQQGDPVIPNVSVAIGVVLGITVDSWRSSRSSTTTRTPWTSARSSTSSRTTRSRCGRPALVATSSRPPRTAAAGGPCPQATGFTVRFDRDGWVQLLDPAGAPRRCTGGRHHPCSTARRAIRDQRIAVLHHLAGTGGPRRSGRGERARRRPCRRDPHAAAGRLVRHPSARRRGAQALSPGVNDPTTAQDAIFHLGAVLRAFLRRDEPARDLDSRRVAGWCSPSRRPRAARRLAYDEIRSAAAPHPAVSIYLLESMSLLRQSLDQQHRQAAERFLRDQASLVLEACERAGLATHDTDRVRRIYTSHFGR